MWNSQVCFRDAEIDETNIIENVNGGNDVFNIMIILKRLTTAAGSVRVVLVVIEIVTNCAIKKKYLVIS
ncbi:MAG: hypothetical protein QXU98_09555 [Candidatus Parvarchaeota archaeon]